VGACLLKSLSTEHAITQGCALHIGAAAPKGWKPASARAQLTHTYTPLQVEFPATPLNDETSVSVVLHNPTPLPQAFEFGVPLQSGLTFLPHIGEVAPNSSLRVQVSWMLQGSCMRRPHSAWQVLGQCLAIWAATPPSKQNVPCSGCLLLLQPSGSQLLQPCFLYNSTLVDACLLLPHTKLAD